MTSHFTSTHPLSPFHNKLQVQRASADQRLVLHNTDLITLLPDLTTDKRQVPAEELPLLLTEEFGVALDDEDAAALVARYE